MMNEPSLLDYLKAKLTPWRGPAPVIPGGEPPSKSTGDQPLHSTTQASELENSIIQTAERVESSPGTTTTLSPGTATLAKAAYWPWLSLLTFGLAVVAQATLEPNPNRTWTIGAFLYLLSAACLVVSSWRGEWIPAPLPRAVKREDPLTVRSYGLLIGIPLALIAFIAFGGNSFTKLNTTLWLLSIAAIVWAFWLPALGAQSWLEKAQTFFAKREWNVTIRWETLLILAAIALILFFRLYRINQVPPEMFSDHAEKLLDVWDVLHGKTSIFFPRNTGREALQMYMTAAIIQLFGTGYSHLSLKIGTVLAGLLTLPFIYLLGKEAGSRRAGLLAAIFAGIAYWPNVISRVGLRFPLYPLFVAPTLYFLLRGIRTSNRNDYILSGLFLGIGLHGYTPIRILPLVVIAAVVLYLLHRQSRGVRKQTVWALAILAVMALIVFLPLLRYALDNPEMFSFRSFSRLGTIEKPLPGPAGQIFVQNLWDALTTFSWDDGQIWVISVTHRPALDIISGALFFAGVVLMIVRYVQKRHWLDLFILLSIPLLMLPSILSLAYPEENPALNRLSGVMVPVFLLIGIALDGLMTSITSKLGESRGVKVAWGLAVTCILLASLQNYGLVFDEYQRIYAQSSWNTSEMGKVIEQFADSVGTPDTAWVLAYPHWVDTRLVGMNAGYPLKDYAIWPDQLADTLSEARAKLFLVKPDDEQGLQMLQALYPQGVVQEYLSKVEFHNFYMVFVPPQG